MVFDLPTFSINLYLFYYDSKWIKKVKKKKDIRQARRSDHVFRYIDDITTLNDGRDFERSYKRNMSSLARAQEENLSSNKGSF